MKLPKRFLHLLGRENRELPAIDDFLDVTTGLWCIGKIPTNLKMEIAADIRHESGVAEPFSASLLRRLVTDAEGFEVVEFALRFFLLLATNLLGDGLPKRDDPMYPWAEALCISPELSVNAGVQLSVDTNAATVFYVINAGVFISLSHRLLAMFADDSFMENIAKAPRRQVGAQVDRNPTEGNWCTLRPHLSDRRMIAGWTAALAAMLIFNHEQAHFHRGHLGYLRDGGAGHRLRELEDPSHGQSVNAADIRRRLELDADETGGRLYGNLLREFGSPFPGPIDGRREGFVGMTLLAAASTFIVFEEGRLSRQYFPPAWRVQHFYTGFLEVYFTEELTEAQTEELLTTMFNVIGHVDARYADLGWGTGFDLGAAVDQTKEFLEVDLPARSRMQAEFSKFIPSKWPTRREHNR